MVKAAVILLLLIFLSGCVDPDPPENVIRYAVNVTEDGVIEISNDNDGLDFGGVPAGSTTYRVIGFDGDSGMQLYCIGEIAHWTTLHPNSFYLSGHQNVTVRIDVPPDAEVGSYESMIVK
jgi:hypothetical protein